MGFKIWAVGYTATSGKVQHFHYERDNCLDKSDFDPPLLLSIISSIPSSASKSDIAQKLVGSPDDKWKGADKAAFAIADLVYAHQLRQEVDLLATHGSGGSISVDCHEKKSYWADESNYVNCWINSKVSAGKEFLRTIAPGLKKTSLNNFGVLLQMAACVSLYNIALPQTEDPHLRITLRH